MLFDVGERQRSGEKYPGLPIGAVELGRHDELGFGQRLRFAKACAAAIRQQVPAALASRTPDPVRVSPRQQYSGGVMRVGRVGAAACDVALPLAGTALRLRDGAAVHGDPRRQVAHVAAQHGDPQPQVGVARAGACTQNIAFAQDGGQVARKTRRAELARLDEHVSQSRVQSELRQCAAVGSDARGGIDGLQLVQQIARLCQRCRGRRIQPRKARGVERSPATQFQSQGCEIRVQYFRRRLRRERCLRALGPQAVTEPCAQTAGAAAPLIGREVVAFAGIARSQQCLGLPQRRIGNQPRRTRFRR